MESDILVSVEGLGAEDWQAAFRQELSKQTGATNLKVFLPSIPGAAGASRRNQVVVRNNTAAVESNTTAVQISSVLAALTIVLSALPMFTENPSQPPTFRCTIEGKSGKKEVEIKNGQSIPPELIQDCLKETGQPQKIHVSPNRRHGQK